MDDQVAAQLAAACTRSAISAETFRALSEAFPSCKILRLCFGMQNKVMVNVTVELREDGRTHASYVPIHPTAAAAAVLQNNPIVVVRAQRKSPLWDQEDVFQREGCQALTVVSMPFFWPPRADAVWEGQPLPTVQSPQYTPTFGTLAAAGAEPITQDELRTLSELAQRTGRHACNHVSVLISSLEAAGLVPTEQEAQREVLMGADEGASSDEDLDALFGFGDAGADAEGGAAALLPSLFAPPAAGGGEAAAAAAGTAAAAAQPLPEAAAGADARGTPDAPIRPALGGQPAPAPARASGLSHRRQPAGGQHSSNAAAAARQAGTGAPPGPAASPAAPPARLPSGGWAEGDDDALAAAAAAPGDMPPPSLLGFGSLMFRTPGLERAFSLHHNKRNEKADMLALGAVLASLLWALAVQARAAWPAGTAALMLFTPYFFDARLYYGLREWLLSAVLLLMAAFRASLSSATHPHGGALAAAAATCAACGGAPAGACGAAGGAGGGEGSLAGFGLFWFVLHTCGLHYVLAAPLLLRIRTSRMVVVQGASLAVALYRLPGAYLATLGRLDTVHILLLGLLLGAGAFAGLSWSRELERRARQEWLARRWRRAAATVDTAAGAPAGGQ